MLLLFIDSCLIKSLVHWLCPISENLCIAGRRCCGSCSSCGFPSTCLLTAWWRAPAEGRPCSDCFRIRTTVGNWVGALRYSLGTFAANAVRCLHIFGSSNLDSSWIGHLDHSVGPWRHLDCLCSRGCLGCWMLTRWTWWRSDCTCCPRRHSLFSLTHVECHHKCYW
jgi:hypothetical protein